MASLARPDMGALPEGAGLWPPPRSTHAEQRAHCVRTACARCRVWKGHRTITPEERWATHGWLDGLHGIGQGLREPKSMMPPHPDSLEDDLDDAGDELDFAPDFASGGSLRPAPQEAKDEAKASRTQFGPPQEPQEPGRSLIPTHPIILRDLPPQAESHPTQAQLSRLHRTLNQRDLLILQSLHDYRYLNTLQVKELFFPSLRSCQMRLQHLKDLGLIYRWKVIETPGVRRRHSLLLISARGARVLADWHGDEARDYIERSHDARDHCWHATHDLEANQFFVALITQSRQCMDEGLLIWYGEEHVRAERRATAREYKSPVPTPDGCGVYLAAGGRILFDLEWDRATESLARLRQKVGSYVGHFEHYRDAELHHVLFVVPTDDREDKLQHTIWRERPRFGHDTCCSFWTTTAYRLRTWGPLGAIWLKVDIRASETPPLSVTRLRKRTALNQLPPIQPNERPIADCVGKPSWWECRPGGGQVA
jgi:Replication-relaxation